MKSLLKALGLAAVTSRDTGGFMARCDEPSCARDIGRTLDAGAFLAGRVGKRGDELEISVRLMETATGATLCRAQVQRMLQ